MLVFHKPFVCAGPTISKREVAEQPPEVRSAISKGLEYLAKMIFRKQMEVGGSQNRVAETSLTLMAFMLQGHVPGRGQYGRAMENAISFLLNQGQNQRGYLGTSKIVQACTNTV